MEVDGCSFEGETLTSCFEWKDRKEEEEEEGMSHLLLPPPPSPLSHHLNQLIVARALLSACVSISSSYGQGLHPLPPTLLKKKRQKRKNDEWNDISAVAWCGVAWAVTD